MERDESCLFKETVIGKVVSFQSSFELAEFFLLIAGKRNPRTGHLFKELEDVLIIGGDEDIRLSALITEIKFLREIEMRLGAARGEAEIVRDF